MNPTGTKCRRCHRTLTISAAAGIGPVCAKRERQEQAAADVKPATLAKAMEDIEDGALINTRRTTKAGRPVFAVLSSTGTRTYLAAPGGRCTCRAGLKGRQCRHAVAAQLAAA